MIDWLRRKPADPTVALAGREVPIAIRRHPTARQLTLRLAPDGSEVRCTMPRWARTVDAIRFAESRIEWLEAQLARQPQGTPPVAGGSIAYRGADLTIAWEHKAGRRPLLKEHGLCLGGPEDGLTRRVRRWLEAEALRLLEADLAEYCAAAGQELPRLMLSRARQRWGSCSSGRVIRINWRLIQAPDWVRRSVVAHEVAHLTHFDHSPAFHALLGELYEADIAEANRWLKQHGRSLYAAFG